jgi:hypothetical protein
VAGLPARRVRSAARGEGARSVPPPHGPQAPFDSPPEEAWLVIGRRGGKSFAVSLIAVYLACFRDYTSVLAPGEGGMVMVIAADRRQARVVFRYIRALLEGVPMLARWIERTTAESIELVNPVTIEIHTASYRGVREYAVVAALLDEVAYWRSEESAVPDVEVLAALRAGALSSGATGRTRIIRLAGALGPVTCGGQSTQWELAGRRRSRIGKWPWGWVSPNRAKAWRLVS